MITKICFKCKKELPLDDFYKHSQMKDGHLNKCKECNKMDVQWNYRKNKNHYKKYERSRLDNKDRRKKRKMYSRWLRRNRPEVIRKKQLKYQERHRDKYKCHIKFRNAVRDGKIVRRPCIECGNTKSEGHHEDYSKPFDVVWLCRDCHAYRHRKAI